MIPKSERAAVFLHDSKARVRRRFFVHTLTSNAEELTCADGNNRDIENPTLAPERTKRTPGAPKRSVHSGWMLTAFFRAKNSDLFRFWGVENAFRSLK